MIAYIGCYRERHGTIWHDAGICSRECVKIFTRCSTVAFPSREIDAGLASWNHRRRCYMQKATCYATIASACCEVSAHFPGESSADACVDGRWD